MSDWFERHRVHEGLVIVNKIRFEPYTIESFVFVLNDNKWHDESLICLCLCVAPSIPHFFLSPIQKRADAADLLSCWIYLRCHRYNLYHWLKKQKTEDSRHKWQCFCPKIICSGSRHWYFIVKISLSFGCLFARVEGPVVFSSFRCDHVLNKCMRDLIFAIVLSCASAQIE